MNSGKRKILVALLAPFEVFGAADAGRPGDDSSNTMVVVASELPGGPGRVTLLDCRYDASRRDSELHFEMLAFKPREDFVTGPSTLSTPICESR